MLSQIRVLVVDDSPTAREIITKILETNSKIKVIGEAKNGQEAITLNKTLKPDIITMDVEMPVMDGITATEEIMAFNPTPILIVTHLLPKRMNLAFEAMSAGALDTILKPCLSDLENLRHADFNNPAKQLIDKVELLSGIKVVTHLSGRIKKLKKEFFPVIDTTVTVPAVNQLNYKLIAIGSSTGGPRTLQSILSQLPKDFPIPIAIVQHISNDFTQGFVDWLDSICKIEVSMANQGSRLSPGRVLVAPPYFHMKINRSLIIELEDSLPVLNQKPAVNVFFSSVAKFCGDRAIGVILTGMGDDGALGLKEMRDAGAYTIAQNEESCVIFGMPKVAIEMGGVEKILHLDKIPEMLMNLSVRQMER